MSKVVPHDYGIICAKSEELAALRPVLEAQFPLQDNSSKPDLPVRVVKKRDEAPAVTVFATCCAKMGHVHAASKTAQMITRHEPRLMLFVGTAASLNPREIRAGDVVIPQSSMFRIYEKIVQKGSSSFSAAAIDGFEEFFFRDTALVANLMIEDLDDDTHVVVSGYRPSVTLEDGDLAPFWKDQLKKPRGPSVETDVDIFTCGMVVDSENYKDFLQSKVGRKAFTIDMESFGFFQTIKQLRKSDAGEHTEGVMIRGISDYGGRKEETEVGGNWKAISMKNAAMVACDFIRQHANQ